MGKYFVLQLKRLLRLMLPIILVAAVLFGCLTVVYDGVLALEEEENILIKSLFLLIQQMFYLYVVVLLKGLLML